MADINWTENLLKALNKLTTASPAACEHSRLRHVVESYIKHSKNEIDLPGVIASLAVQLQRAEAESTRFMYKACDAEIEGLKVIQKHRNARLKGGLTCAAERRLERSIDWDIWQAHASEIWRLNPKLSKSEVARRIASRRGIGEKPDTIRKQINNNQKS